MLSSFRILSKIGGVALGAAIVALAAGYAPANADEPGVVRLTALNGDVAVRRGDTSGTFAASANTPLMVSDYLSTGPGAAHAELQFDRGNFLRLGPNVQLRIAKLDPGDHTVQLAEGTVELSSLHPTDGHAEIDTPSIAVRPGSNGRYRVTVNQDGTTLVTVRSGSADLVGTSGTRTIDAGQTIAITGSPNDPRFENVSFVASDEFDTWNQQRDTFDNNDTGYQYASPQIAGIPDLSQYGTWNNSQQYGMGWTPNDVGPNWSPYQDGQWTWEPGYGYTWIGNEPWGWAPYHYGSWEYNGTAWAWYPNAQPTYNQYGSAQGQYPQQYPAGQYPSGQYPQQYPNGQYPQQYPSGQYPQQYPPQQYPAQYPPAQYPPQYPAQYPPAQYPPQYPAQYPQGAYPYPPQAGYGYPASPYGYGYPAANNSSVLWAPALVAFLGLMSGENVGQSLLGGLGTGGVGWVPLAPGEPMYPWWGAQQSAWYGYPAQTYYPNYPQYAYGSQPMSSSYTTYNVTNVYKVYRNARAPHGVMVVSTKAFQNGSFKTIRATSINDLRLEDGKVGNVAVFRNVVPVTPTAANLRFNEAGPTRIAAIAPRTALFSRFTAPKAQTQFSAVREKVATATEHVYAAHSAQPVYQERRAAEPQSAQQRTIDPQADRAAQQAAAERKADENAAAERKADDAASAERRADQAAADRKAEPAARNNDTPAWQRYNDNRTTNPNRDTTAPARTNNAQDRTYSAPAHPYASQSNTDRQYNGDRQYNAQRTYTAPHPQQQQQPRPQSQPQHHNPPQPQHAAPSKGSSSSNHGGNNNNNDKHQGNGH